MKKFYVCGRCETIRGSQGNCPICNQELEKIDVEKNTYEKTSWQLFGLMITIGIAGLVFGAIFRTEICLIEGCGLAFSLFIPIVWFIFGYPSFVKQKNDHFFLDNFFQSR